MAISLAKLDEMLMILHQHGGPCTFSCSAHLIGWMSKILYTRGYTPRPKPPFLGFTVDTLLEIITHDLTSPPSSEKHCLQDCLKEYQKTIEQYSNKIGRVVAVELFPAM
jgi:hypothetical protein